MAALWGHGRPPPDDPLRRALWILPLALLLVLVAVLGTGRWLQGVAPPPPPKPAPVDARIYELPPSPGGAGASAHRPAPPQRHQAAKPKPAPSAPSKPAAAHFPALPKSPRRVPQRHANTTPQARAERPPAVDWSALASQISSAVSSAASDTAFNQVHDPHTLIARYYLAALLEKLQRTGDMVYPDDKTGSVMVRLIIGADGHVRALEVEPLDGSPALKGVAREIVHMSTPFSPFPDKLARATKRLKLEIRMAFLGAHNVNTQ